MRPRRPTRQQQDGDVRACEQKQQHRRREDQNEGRHKLGRPFLLYQTSYERTHLLRKASRRFLGELVEERLKSLFGHAWSDTPFETGLDGPSTGADGCKGRIELQIKRNENLRTSGKVLTWQHANHGVRLAV
jgi:hypothetical protein